MCERQLDFAWHGALGEYGKIREIIAALFGFFSETGSLVRMIS